MSVVLHGLGATLVKTDNRQACMDKLNVAMGAGAGAITGGLIGGKRGAGIGTLAGGGGAALYTYKLRKKHHRRYRKP